MLNGVDSQSDLRTVLAQIADYPVIQIQNLLPWSTDSLFQIHSSLTA
jgi:hypothetical protein